MRITISRYTPNLKNGKDINFEIGEVVNYRTRNGEEYIITIDSKRMAKKAEGKIFYGYEAIFNDDKQRYFAVEDGIYNWKTYSIIIIIIIMDKILLIKEN